MPYSASKIIEKKTEKHIDKVIKSITETCYNALDLTAQDLYKEAYRIFDECIDQFYKYKTRSYHRHETGKGTRTGINLYRASQFKLNYGADEHVFSFYFGWNGDDMDSYKPWKDRDGNIHPVDKEYVLDNVMSGIRGLEDEYMLKGFAPYDNHWSAKINSRYFGNMTGTPDDIFDIFESQWDNVSRELFRKHFIALYKPFK